MGRVDETLKRIGTRFRLIHTDVHGRNERIARIHIGDSVKLVRQPKNTQDPNTIVVKNQEGSLGLLPSYATKELAPLFDEKKILYKAKIVQISPKTGAAVSKNRQEITVEIQFKERENKKETTQTQEKEAEIEQHMGKTQFEENSGKKSFEKDSAEKTVEEKEQEKSAEKTLEKEEQEDSVEKTLEEQEQEELSDDEILLRAIAKERRLWEEEIEGYKEQLQILSKLQFIQRRKLNAEIALVKRQLKGLDMQEKNLRS